MQAVQKLNYSDRKGSARIDSTRPLAVSNCALRLNREPCRRRISAIVSWTSTLSSEFAFNIDILWTKEDVVALRSMMECVGSLVDNSKYLLVSEEAALKSRRPKFRQVVIRYNITKIISLYSMIFPLTNFRIKTRGYHKISYWISDAKKLTSSLVYKLLTEFCIIHV